MRHLSLIGGAVAVVLVGLAAACGSSPASRLPTSPSAPGISGLQITGPPSVAPGQSVQFVADTRLSDGAVKFTTNAASIRWRSSNPSVLNVNMSGLVTAGPNVGEAVITADVLPTGSIRGTREIVVVPNGTYRVVGAVREAEAPSIGVAGAQLQVSGTSVVATTDFNGQYRLYGVPPSADIRVTATGYQSVSQSVQLSAHATQNFLMPLSGPRLSLSGPFLVKIDVVGSCGGFGTQLSPDLRNRAFEASVTTTGSQVDVLLTENRFKVNGFRRGNRFSGRADPNGVRFTLEDPFYYYYYGPESLPNVVERLSNNTHLVIAGTAVTTASGGGVSGPMTGYLTNYDSRYPNFLQFLGGCFSAPIQLTLTPR